MIGITERGDAALNYSWTSRLNTVSGAILITKNADEHFRNEVLHLHQAKKPLIIHATCTGWGGTWLEPNVPEYETQIKNIRALIDAGFSEERVVLRIDPIIPYKQGFDRVRDVLSCMQDNGLTLRVRISVLDNYPHVRERFRQAGHIALYNGAFQPSKEHVEMAKQVLAEIAHRFHIAFEACAEPQLACPEIIPTGCVSETDLRILGLNAEFHRTNPQNRYGCLCLADKKELLTKKNRCPHQCIYCYWQD